MFAIGMAGARGAGTGKSSDFADSFGFSVCHMFGSVEGRVSRGAKNLVAVGYYELP